MLDNLVLPCYNIKAGSREHRKTKMERYRSGHNEAVLKTVWLNGHVGSNPTLSAIFFADLPKWWRGSPAKGVGRETGARVQISQSAPDTNLCNKPRIYGVCFFFILWNCVSAWFAGTHFLPWVTFFSRIFTFFCQRKSHILSLVWQKSG